MTDRLRLAYRGFALVLLVSVGVFNAMQLVEAYGDGPPYYSRTTNMDKWVSPWPTLLTFDLAALAVLLVCARAFRRKR